MAAASVVVTPPLPKQVAAAMAVALAHVSKHYDTKLRTLDKTASLRFVEQLFHSRLFLTSLRDFPAFRRAAAKASQSELDQALFAVILHWAASTENEDDPNQDDVYYYDMEFTVRLLLDTFLANANCLNGSILWVILEYRNHRHRARLFELLIRHGAQDNTDMHAMLAANNEVALQSVLRRYGHL